MPQPATPPAVSVFQFLDAREFLRQAYQNTRRGNPAFSQRYIAQTLKAGSSSFFRDVLSGKSKLTPARVLGFARLFKLNKAETAHFENLVQYTQAESEAEKTHALEKLKAASPSGNQALLAAFQMEYFAKWHYAAVRELLAVHDFRGDHAELGSLLNPPVSPVEAQEAVQLLLKLKLIVKTAQGGYKPTDRVIVSGPNAAMHVRPALLGHLDLARRALDAFPAKQRPFSYTTVSVSEDSVREIHEKLRVLNREVLEVAARDPNVDRLYQLNLQLFPLSEVIQRRKK